jgi:hypothetical protein
VGTVRSRALGLYSALRACSVIVFRSSLQSRFTVATRFLRSKHAWSCELSRLVRGLRTRPREGTHCSVGTMPDLCFDMSSAGSASAATRAASSSASSSCRAAQTFRRQAGPQGRSARGGTATYECGTHGRHLHAVDLLQSRRHSCRRTPGRSRHSEREAGRHARAVA